MKITYSDSFQQSLESYFHTVRFNDTQFAVQGFRPATPQDDPSLIIDGSTVGGQYAGMQLIYMSGCTVLFEDLRCQLSWRDCSAWTGGTRLKSWHNITAETHQSKSRIGQYFGRYQKVNTERMCAVHLYVPFADSPNQDLHIHVLTQHASYPLIVNDVPQTEGRRDPPDVQAEVFPQLQMSAPTEVDQQGGLVTVRLVDYTGNLISRSCETRLETVSGYLPKTRINLVNGEGSFKVLPIGLDAGDTIRVKAGLGYVTGMADVTINVK